MCKKKNLLLNRILIEILFLLDIILRVKDTNHEVFRPRLAELNTTPKFVTDVIKECWAQDPEKRPEFKTIRSKLKELQRGM